MRGGKCLASVVGMVMSLAMAREVPDPREKSLLYRSCDTVKEGEREG